MQSRAINDYRGRPGEMDRLQNVKFEEVVLDNWPHVFVIATRDIAADTELLVDYGLWRMRGEPLNRLQTRFP